MATAPRGADAAALEKVKVKVQAEFWIDPLDHVPLAERRAMLLTGRRVESSRSSPVCGVDAALKQVTPRLLLEVFTSELAHALKPLNTHGHPEQIVIESSSQYDIKNGPSSREQICDGTFADRRSVEIQNNAVAINFEPVSVNVGDRRPFEDCRSEDSQPNVCRCSYVVPCFGLKGCSSGQRDAGAGFDDMVLSSPDHIIKVKVEPSDNSVHRDACIPRERENNMTIESEQEQDDHISLHEGCKLSLFSSISVGCSQVDVLLEPGHCLSSLAGARNITTTQGRRTPICYSEAAYREDLSSHSWGMSGQGYSYLENDVKEHGADKLNDENNNVDTEFPSEKYVANSSEVNAAEHICTSMNDTPESSIALSPCVGVRLSSMGANNQYDAYLGAGNLQREGNNDINSDRACGAENIAAVAGLQEQSSLKAKKRWLSDSTLSTDPGRMKYKFGDNHCLSEESAAKRMRTSISVYPESYTPTRVSEVLSDACMDHFSSGSSNLPEKEAQSPGVGQKGTHFKVDCLVHDSSLSTSNVMVKVEPADEDADGQLSETDTLREPCLLHPSPNTQGTFQAFICQENIPFVHNLQENHEHGGTCSQETFTKHRKAPLVAEREGNFGSKSQLCVSALSFSHDRVKVEATEENSNNQVLAANAANDLCGSVLCSREGFAIRSKGNMSEENCNNQASEVNDSNPACTSVFGSRENSVPVSPCNAAEILSKGVSCKQSVSSSANDLQGNQRCTMFSDRMPEDVLGAVKGKNCSNTGSQSPDGAFLFSPGRVKVEPPEEIIAVRSSETTTATKLCALTFDSSNKFGGDPCQATLCSICDMQTIREGGTICSDMMPASVAAGSNLRDVCKCTFPMRVKDELLVEDHVDGDSESKTKKYSSLSTFDTPINAVVLNPLPDILCSSKAINCQSDTPSSVCNVQNNQESIISSSKVNIPEDNGIGTGQKQTCMANQHIDSDVSAYKDIKNVEQLEKRCANIISENTVEILNSSYSSSNLILKSELLESGIENLCSNPLGSFPSSDMLSVQAKSEVVDELSLDILDHMPLTERIRTLASSMVSGLKPARKSRYFKQTRVHAVGCDSVDSLQVKAKSSSHRRKRKKTATDSVEIALEEDAPGLLQGLLDRGINLDEIKLYGCEEDIDALDISSGESFEDLEAVISKLFSEQPTSLFKLAPLRPVKGTKAVYCLACLISLIEQTRYLQFRNCPVEWGWCRDLQSFIFVFKMHNRIVLERPEYGYATYFFELVESFPIDWQIKRLVTAMKLTSCSRATLIENKSLLVGMDLSEGEAHVLEEYGWRPNTGLGSMLNYCDRVVHDRNERDTSEWRLKIGKLLMDGYDGGRIVKVDLPKKVIDYVGSQYPEIKMET